MLFGVEVLPCLKIAISNTLPCSVRSRASRPFYAVCVIFDAYVFGSRPIPNRTRIGPLPTFVSKFLPCLIFWTGQPVSMSFPGQPFFSGFWRQFLSKVIKGANQFLYIFVIFWTALLFWFKLIPQTDCNYNCTINVAFVKLFARNAPTQFIVSDQWRSIFLCRFFRVPIGERLFEKLRNASQITLDSDFIMVFESSLPEALSSN